MIRVLNTVDNNVFSVNIPPVVVPAVVSTEILADSKGIQEIAYIEIFNAGANTTYYNFGADCDNVSNYRAFLVPGQMLEVAVRQRVTCYSIGGTTISITMLKRDDAIQPGKNIL